MVETILITGAGGYIGGELLRHLGRNASYKLIATDIRETPTPQRIDDVTYYQADIRDETFFQLVAKERPSVVVHLASIVSAGNNPQFEYSVDVEGTRNVLKACTANDVRQLVITSSGAAYGYYADNPSWIDETDPLRGNEDFAYSRHKRMVEEMLAEYRKTHPALKQLIFRPGAVIGETVSNQITNLFEKPFVLGIVGSDSPFTFIWDRDVVACFIKGITENREGIFNLAGDGALSLKEIAAILGKPYLPLPAWLIGGALGLVRKFGLGKLGPEHVKFLQYRPVLSNRRLKEEFGLVPTKTSRETFDLYRATRFKGAQR